jgi:hypothetical protein
MSDGRYDSGARCGVLVMDARVKLWDISCGMCCGKFAQAVSGNIACTVLCILQVLKKGCPELLCNTFKLPMRAMRYDLD